MAKLKQIKATEEDHPPRCGAVKYGLNYRYECDRFEHNDATHACVDPPWLVRWSDNGAGITMRWVK